MPRQKRKRLDGYNPFTDNYKTYDSVGHGSSSEWRSSFYERMGFDKAIEVLGDDDPMVVFGLGANATWEDVLSTYRKLSIKHHPDRGGNSATMIKINAAFEVLERRFCKN